MAHNYGGHSAASEGASFNLTRSHATAARLSCYPVASCIGWKPAGVLRAWQISVLVLLMLCRRQDVGGFPETLGAPTANSCYSVWSSSWEGPWSVCFIFGV